MVINGNEKAFTLMELMIVVLIMAFLLTLTISAGSLLKRSGIIKLYTDLESLSMMQKDFNDTYGFLPGDMPSQALLDIWDLDKINHKCPVIPSNAQWSAAEAPGGNGNGLIDACSDIAHNNDPNIKASECAGSLCHLALDGRLSFPDQIGLLKGRASSGTNAGTLQYHAKYGKPASMGQYITFTPIGLLVYGNTAYPGGGSAAHYEPGSFYGNLTSKIAKNLDIKFDDGNPGSGNIKAYFILPDDTAPGASSCCSKTSQHNGSATAKIQEIAGFADNLYSCTPDSIYNDNGGECLIAYGNIKGKAPGFD